MLHVDPFAKVLRGRELYVQLKTETKTIFYLKNGGTV